MPFVVFQVERILAAADTGSAEGRDRALQELAPVLQGLPASVLRDELMRRVAGRLELTEGQLRGRLSSVSASAAPARRRAGVGNGHASDGRPASPLPPAPQAPRAERVFLALCIALPGPGRARCWAGSTSTSS